MVVKYSYVRTVCDLDQQVNKYRLDEIWLKMVDENMSSNKIAEKSNKLNVSGNGWISTCYESPLGLSFS